MNPETFTEPKQYESASPQLQEQAEVRRELESKLCEEFDTSRADAPSYSAREIDRFVDSAVTAGGLVRQDADKGLTDPNFPGGKLEGTTPDWVNILSQLRDGKDAYLQREADDMLKNYDLTKSSAEAPLQPLKFAEQQLTELKKEGVIKEETGLDARPDGLFPGNRLFPTSESVRPVLEQLREQTIRLVKEQTVHNLNDRVSASSDKGHALGEAVRDAALRGMIDLTLVPRKSTTNTVRRNEIVPATVGDARVSELTRINMVAIEDQLTKLTSDERRSFNTFLLNLDRQKELAGIRKAGALHRDELLSGADASGALEARLKLAQLDKIDAQHDLLSNLNIPGGYAGNIDATRQREAAEQTAAKRKDKFASGRQIRNALRNGILDADAAHETALGEDREAREQSRVYSEHQSRIDELSATIENTSDRPIQTELRQQLKRLEADRDTATDAEALRQKGITSETVKAIVSTLNGARNHEATARTINKQTPVMVEQAMANREALNLDPLPFLESKQGGIFTSVKRRGPKVLESYFSPPDNDHVVVVERRNRRTGDLLSQTIFTTEKPIRYKGGDNKLPPRELREAMEVVRLADKQNLVKSTGSGLGSRNIGDFIKLGLRVGRAIDGGDLSDSGVYKEYGATNDDLNKFKSARNKRKGGLLYWLTGGRT